MKRHATTAAWLLLASPLILLVGGAILALVLSSSPAEIGRQMHESAVLDALVISLKTTLVSLVLVIVCGTAFALVIHRTRGALSGGLEVLVTLPAIMPPSVAGIALLLAFGRQGLLGSTFSHWGISIAFTPIAVVMAQTFVAAPFYVREAANAFQAIDPTYLEAATLDGASAWQSLRWVTLPVIAPFLLTGAVLAWARALGEFGATILFAGSLQGVTQTLPLAIYLGFETDLEQAKAIAVLLLVAAVFLLVLLRLVLRRRLVYAH